MNVIDNKKVYASVKGRKLIDPVRLNCFNKFNRKLFAGDVNNALGFADSDGMVTKRMHQVCLAEACAAIHNKRIVACAPRIVRNCKCSSPS